MCYFQPCQILCELRIHPPEDRARNDAEDHPDVEVFLPDTQFSLLPFHCSAHPLLLALEAELLLQVAGELDSAAFAGELIQRRRLLDQLRLLLEVIEA